ncbi:MAG: sigma 54-interacting transcriptional regulator [Candidatus Cloacimonetes bacterium]|nr:sigma 54-interacting transcriptional regulator [Candidatus Cloacimonadota bacterium]
MGNKKEQSLIIANRYRIIEELGKGSMGIVYKVQDSFRSNELKALKTIRKEIVNFNVLAYFKKEFEIMSRLRHPNLVQVYDFGFERYQDFYYLTMEYVNGKTLGELLKLEQKLDEKKTLDIIVSLCRTLGFIHSRNILHRDIKPSNILIKGNKIKITDFGLSDIENEEHKTKGSLIYAAPEILSGKADNRSDIFSTGMVFYELITRKNFYHNKSTSEIFEILKSDNKFSNYKNNIVKVIKNPNIREIISIILDFFPENRFQYCSEIIHSINKNLKRNFSLEIAKTRESYVLGAGFVGRKDELAKLKKSLEINNSNKIFLVKGKVGIGKSRLFHEFRKYCQLKNIEFLEANCREKITKAYAPFIDILNDILPCASKEIIEKFGPELKKILSAHKIFAEIIVNPVQEPKVEREILIQNITNFLLEYSKQQNSKVTIYLNDLHWADEASLEVLQELMYKITRIENVKDSKVNLFIFSSVREEEINNIETTLTKLRDKKRLEEIELHPFDTKDVSNYIEAIFGEDYISDSLQVEISEIGKKVGGNPFFLQQLIKSLVKKGLISRKILKWELLKPIKDIEIPKNLKEIIKKSIENLRLSNDGKKVLQYFTLLDKPINIAEFKQILPKKIDINLKDFFKDLENKELLVSSQFKNDEEKIGLPIVEPHPNLLLKKGEGTIRNKPILEKQQKIETNNFLFPVSSFQFSPYTFTHSLIREVIEEEITEKQEFHHHIAQKIENIYKENINEYLDELANHYSHTDDNEKIIHYLEKAGDKAKDNYENEKAIGYYDKLLKNLGDLKIQENKKKKIEILHKKCVIFELIGKWDDYLKIAEYSLSLSEKINDKLLLGKSKKLIGNILDNKGNYKKALELFDESLNIFNGLDNKEERCNIFICIGVTSNNQGNKEKAMEYYKKSLVISEELGNKKNIAIVLGNIGLLYNSQDNYEKAMKYNKKSLKIHKELGDKKGISTILANRGIIYTNQGNFEKALEYYKKSLKICEKLGDKKGIGNTLCNIGVIYQYQSNYEKAMNYNKKSLEISEELGNKQNICLDLGSIGNIYVYQGNFKKAMEYYKKSLEISEELGNKRTMCIDLGNIGNVYYYQSNFEEAMKYYKKSLKSFKELGDNKAMCIALCNIGNIYRTQGNYKKAMNYFYKGMKISEELDYKQYISSTLVNIGIINDDLGNYEKAMECYNKSLEICKELGNKQLSSIVLENIGNIYKKTKRYSEAEENFDKAISLSEELGLKSSIGGQFFSKSDLYFILKKYKKASKSNKQSQKIARELNQENLLFYIHVLSAKITFHQDTKSQNKLSAIKELEDMLSKVKGNKEQIAILSYELWKMEKEIRNEKLVPKAFGINVEKYREKALKLYQELYKKTPNKEYIERIEEMEEEEETREKGKGKKEKEKEEKNSVLSVSSACPVRKDDCIGVVNHQAKYFSEFIDIVLKLNNLHSSELYRKIVDLSVRFVDAERGFLLIYNEQGELQVEIARDERGKELEIKNKEKENATQTSNFKFLPKAFGTGLISQTVINKVIKTGKPLFVPNIAEFKEIDKAQSVLDLKLQSVMCIPLGRKSELNRDDEKRKYFPTQSAFLGILYLDSTKITEETKFKGENLNLLQAIADQASFTLINTLLYEKTNVDSLTGLYLRPYFEDRLNSEIQFHKTHKSTFCLLMIDVDLFKNINDSYGYPKGDQVLQTLGEIFNKKFRSSDICARYGGDEFVVLLNNINIKQAEIVAEELLQVVNSTEFSGTKITVSIGISEFNKNTKDLSQLLKYADDALYAAKAVGRNCFRTWKNSYSNIKQSHIFDILTGDPIRDYRNVEMLLQSIKTSISVLNYKDLFDKIVDTILEITNSERCLFILKKDKKDWEIKLAKHNKGELLTERNNYSKTLIDEVIKTGIPYCLKDISDEEATQSQIYLNLKSAMCVPLQIKDKLLGVIYVDSQYALQQFSPSELSIFSAVASQLAMIIENTRLHAKAIEAEKVKERLLEEEIIDLHKKMKGEAMILGKSKTMKTVFSQIGKVARTDSSVLLYGETGTGKELTARAIHNASFRHEKPFIIADCGAISAELIEGELFGHEKGSYTGAYSQKKGLFEAADSGTILLDEIGELPMYLQPKLLRFLQEKNIRRIGGTRRIKVNVRVIAATNKNLEKMISEKKFREDLYYRLNVFPIELPPLRERKDDVLILADYFLKLYGRTRHIKGFTKEAIELLETYQWAGNVRELQHKIEKAVIMSESEYISVEDLELSLNSVENQFQKRSSSDFNSNNNHLLLTDDDIIKAKESPKSELMTILKKRIINEILRFTGNNINEAAKLLGIDRSTLRRIKSSNVKIE